MESIIFIIIFIIFSAVVLYCILVPIKKNMKITNGVINYDPYLRKYFYKVNSSKEQIISRLKIRNAGDELEYKFDEDNLIITFSLFNEYQKIKYSINIDEFSTFCILCVERISGLFERSTIPYKVNSFWVKKVDAEIFPYIK